MASPNPTSSLPPTIFQLELASRSMEDLAVIEVRLDEEISRPYFADVTFVAQDGVDLGQAETIGSPATLHLHVSESCTRFVHGMVSSLERWDAGTGADRNRYIARIVPSLWKLGYRRRSRIFQNMTVPEIVSKILNESQVRHRMSLDASYPTRVYSVQYRESDLEFVSRLLEEEGIFYIFEHEQKRHTLVLLDSASSRPPLPGDCSIPFRGSGALSTGEHVDSFLCRHEVRPTAVALRDYNYLPPNVPGACEPGPGTELEIYDYPGGFTDASRAKALSGIRLQEVRLRADTASGSSVSPRLSPGWCFQLVDHPVHDFNGEYLLLSVRHHGLSPELVRRGRPGESSLELRPYSNVLTCIRRGLPFRPERRTPRPVIAGPQTATVVGPAGEEIHTDQHGRIKVHFHWDREGRSDESASCWVRVSQAWAGSGWGALYLPRIGHEVVVEFLEGDPDRPIVTGSVYNGANPPPLDLPRDKTKSTLRSASSPGSKGENEIRFEDAAGAEEIFLHAQKDWNIVVENDKTQHVGGKETLAVDQDRSRTVKGCQTLHVGMDDTSTIEGNQTLQVALNRTTTIMQDHKQEVLGNQTVFVGATHTVTVGLAASETVGLAKTVGIGADYTVKVGAAMAEIVAGHKTEQVGAGKTESVGGNKTQVVTGSRTLKVAGDLTESVDQSCTLKVAKSLVISAAEAMEHQAGQSYLLKAKEIVLEAADQVMFTVGSSSISFKKDGDVTIKGSKIRVNASGNLILKGNKISEN